MAETEKQPGFIKRQIGLIGQALRNFALDGDKPNGKLAEFGMRMMQSGGRSTNIFVETARSLSFQDKRYNATILDRMAKAARILTPDQVKAMINEGYGQSRHNCTTIAVQSQSQESFDFITRLQHILKDKGMPKGSLDEAHQAHTLAACGKDMVQLLTKTGFCNPAARTKSDRNAVTIMLDEIPGKTLRQSGKQDFVYMNWVAQKLAEMQKAGVDIATQDGRGKGLDRLKLDSPELGKYLHGQIERNLGLKPSPARAQMPYTPRHDPEHSAAAQAWMQNRTGACNT